MHSLKPCNHQDDFPLPEGKKAYPTRPGQAPFRSLEKYLDCAPLSDRRDVIREVRGHAIQKLELLDQMHNDLVRQARSIVEKAREDLRLHSIRMFAEKIRGKTYFLYAGPDNDEFFSILEPEEYARADLKARYLGAYRLNEDSSWTQFDGEGR